jgi:uncharacterized protein (DUF58 family)
VLKRRHDVIAATITDPREAELPRAGLVEIEDAETGRRTLLDTSSTKQRQRYLAENRRRRDAVGASIQRLGVDRLDIRTDTPFIHDLIELFRRRERRR